MRIAQLSDTGLVRPINEDSIYSSTKKDLFIVADGMGGHQGGEVASKTAVNKIKYYIRNKYDIYSKNQTGFTKLICDSINYASKAVFEISKKDSDLYGMGTTIIVCLVYNDVFYIGHVGDSRVYLINNKIKQITKDHSLVQELLDNRVITKEEAINHPHKNVITRAVGTQESVKADIFTLKLKDKEKILLCTDGLTNMVEDEKILDKVNKYPPKKAAELLLEEANNSGGVDNISIMIIENRNNIGGVKE